jgi:hypothetical protein
MAPEILHDQRIPEEGGARHITQMKKPSMQPR